MRTAGKFLRFGVFFGILTGFSAPGFSAIIFDNADPLSQGTTTRTPPVLGVAAYLKIDATDVQITQIAIDVAPGQNGQLKFVIFSDSSSPSDAGSLLLSDTVNVTASTTLSYILSDPISFTLQAGHYYDVGATFNGSSITYSFDSTGDAQNGITSLVGTNAGNENVQGFASPTLVGHASADIDIQLFGPVATSVPEPASLTLFGIALALAGGRRFVRKQL